MNSKNVLFICAHPDDETLFFMGQILKHNKNTKIICVTNANADKRGKQRKIEFTKACKLLNVQDFEMLSFEDIYEKRLNIDKLIKKLKSYSSQSLSKVFTHNPIGEYGHPHHQDICYACYQVFNPNILWTTSYNTYHQEIIQLTPEQFELKSQILLEVYGLETRRFLNLIPIQSIEAYRQFSKEEVMQIYEYISHNQISLNEDGFKHLKEVIKSSYLNLKRPF